MLHGNKGTAEGQLVTCTSYSGMPSDSLVDNLLLIFRDPPTIISIMLCCTAQNFQY